MSKKIKSIIQKKIYKYKYKSQSDISAATSRTLTEGDKCSI